MIGYASSNKSSVIYMVVQSLPPTQIQKVRNAKAIRKKCERKHKLHRTSFYCLNADAKNDLGGVFVGGDR